MTRKLLAVEVPDHIDFRGRPSLGIFVRGVIPSAEELGRVALTEIKRQLASGPEIDHIFLPALGQAILDALTKVKPA